MELLLGMEPMTQYDAAATPSGRVSATAPRRSRSRLLHQSSLTRMCREPMAEKVGAVFLYEGDTNNDIEFNRVLWHDEGDVPFRVDEGGVCS